MTGAPVKSNIVVQQVPLPGPRYLIEWNGAGPEELADLKVRGAEAALGLLRRQCGDLPVPPPESQTSDPSAAFKQHMLLALARAGVPDRLGVFVKVEPNCPGETPVPLDVAMALLSRRSGPLYLPSRRFTPSLLKPTLVAVVFPEP